MEEEVCLSGAILRLVADAKSMLTKVLISARKKDPVRRAKLVANFAEKTRGRFAALLVAWRWSKNKQLLVR